MGVAPHYTLLTLLTLLLLLTLLTLLTCSFGFFSSSNIYYEFKCNELFSGI